MPQLCLHASPVCKFGGKLDIQSKTKVEHLSKTLRPAPEKSKTGRYRSRDRTKTTRDFVFTFTPQHLLWCILTIHTIWLLLYIQLRSPLETHKRSVRPDTPHLLHREWGTLEHGHTTDIHDHKSKNLTFSLHCGYCAWRCDLDGRFIHRGQHTSATWMDAQRSTQVSRLALVCWPRWYVSKPTFDQWLLRASCTVGTLFKMYKLFTFVRIGAATTLLHHYLYQAARDTHRSLVQTCGIMVDFKIK
jgi:hypothetical protein